MKLKANKELWPDEWKSSQDFYNPKFDYYYDLEYTCRACNQDKVWTAVEQKNHYEALKKVRGVSALCEECFGEYNLLKNKFRKFKELWSLETENSKKSAPYINEWLNTISEYKRYTDKVDVAMEHKLASLLAEDKPNKAQKKDADKSSAF